MKPLACCFLSLGIFASGCATAPKGPPPPGAPDRNSLGRIGLVAFSNAEGVRLQVPASTEEVRRMGIEPQLFTSRMFAGHLGPVAELTQLLGPEAALGLLVGVPIAATALDPIFQSLHKLYALAATDSDAAIEAARGHLGPLARSTAFETLLAEQVGNRVTGLVPITRTPGRPGPLSQYEPLAREGFRHILELAVFEPALQGREGWNPAVGFKVHVRVRVLRLSSPVREVYYDYLEYHGPKSPFVSWGAVDSTPLAREIERSARLLGDEIAAAVFPGETRSDPGRSLAQGLTRRPGSRIVQPAPGPVYRPVRTAATR